MRSQCQRMRTKWEPMRIQFLRMRTAWEGSLEAVLVKFSSLQKLTMPALVVTIKQTLTRCYRNQQGPAIYTIQMQVNLRKKDQSLEPQDFVGSNQRKNYKPECYFTSLAVI